jgi:hypothetical protein
MNAAAWLPPRTAGMLLEHFQRKPAPQLNAKPMPISLKKIRQN